MPSTWPFSLTDTYVHLEEGGRAETLPVTEDFWPDLLAGRRRLDGRLVMVVEARRDMAHWERHPAGEELILLLSGSVDFILQDRAGREDVVGLRAKAPCLLVPPGVWHRYVVRSPGDLLFVTAGTGTEHRPVGG